MNTKRKSTKKKPARKPVAKAKKQSVSQFQRTKTNGFAGIAFAARLLGVEFIIVAPNKPQLRKAWELCRMPMAINMAMCKKAAVEQG